VYDKNKARIGDGTLDFNNLAGVETIKIKVTASTAGVPVSLSLLASNLPAELQSYLAPASKMTNVTVYSVPSGAKLTVELRDGTVLTADVESLDATSITLHVGGNLQKFDRNQVKRVLLVPREAPH
jgi:hypothetical protein